MLQNLVESLRALIPAGAAAATTLGAMIALHYLLGRSGRRRNLAQLRLAASIFLSLIGLLVVAFFLPIDDTLRAQIVGLGGVLVVALASTTFLGNALAGVLLRIVGNFEIGDWLKVDGRFGRVSERGIFHTEIETEDRDLTTLPNLYLVTQPVTVVRSSGTIISAEVSLGYDVGHQRVKALLLVAADKVRVGDPPSGLKEAFVQIRELGDYSVTYRISGLLGNVKRMLSARSRLKAAMLTTLHEAGVEIVSPTFMNTRALTGARTIPEAYFEEASANGEGERAGVESGPEEVAFDKADQAEQAELRGEPDGNLAAELLDQESRLQQAGVDNEVGSEET